jgi:hypothetical protein
VPRGAVNAWWAVALFGACGEPSSEGAPPSPALEHAIATQLGARIGLPVRVWCGVLPPQCIATLPDRAELPIRLVPTRDGWTWRVDGLVVTADPIEAYLRETLLDLGAVQQVTCTPRIRLLDPGDRVACDLEHGGKAFVTVNADGSFAVEIELDPIAGRARSEDLVDLELVDRASEPGSRPTEGDAGAAEDDE